MGLVYSSVIDAPISEAAMVAAGVGVAVMPEAAARRCARSMPLAVLAIRDSWANRQLVICARSFKSLPKPAKLLVDHLRKPAR